MSTTATVEFRAGFRTITPYLLPAKAEYVDFLKNVFGAVETERTETGPGRFHAEYRIDDSMLMLGVGSGMSMPAALELYVPDVDAVYKRAIEAGCKELESVRDAHWEPGLRLGTLEDPEGNVWSIATRSGKSYIPEGRGALSAGFAAKGAANLVEFLKSAFNAEQLTRWEWPGGLYASLRIGESVVGVSEASGHEWMKPMPSMIYMYVPDCDALYAQAMRAGAKSISEPKNQAYGDRHGAVQDEWGNQWYMATPMPDKIAELRPGFRTLTPYLLPPDAAYVDFLKNVFDAKEMFRGQTGPNSFHAEFKIGDSNVMVGVGSNRSMPAGLIIYVPNADETYARALANGAKSLQEIVENYGDRFGVVEDPAGNGWCIATYLGREPIVGQGQLNTITISFAVPGAARFIDFVKRAFFGSEMVRYDSPEGKVMHAKIRIGNSALAVGEAHGQWLSKPTMIYLYVPDCDATYQQALRVGAKSILEPKDQPYGDRQGGVEDEWGNQWFISTPFRANYT